MAIDRTTRLLHATARYQTARIHWYVAKIVDESDHYRLCVLVVTGDEDDALSVMKLRARLQVEGIPTAVVSLPCWESFDEQDPDYREAVPGVDTVRIGVEAAVRFGWDRYLGERGGFVGMTGFGASGPADALYEHFALPAFEHQLIEYDHTQADQVVTRLNGATIAITNKLPLTANVIEQLPSLKLVAVAATGTDCVDKEMCERHGIRVSNIRGYAVNTVPEHTFALVLALRRNLIAYRDDVLHGEWQKSGQFCFFNYPIHDLGGMTLGTIGESVLGQRVAEIAKAFGMHPLFAAHKGRAGLGSLYTPGDEILATSDIVTIHSPLTPQTRGMLAMPEFRAMKRKPSIRRGAGLWIKKRLCRRLTSG